jgi:aspartyl-tRNA(Asn)/glutamyl-tRNA(Gln) amidotransferase subunit A
LTDDLAQLSAAHLSRLYKKGKLSPVEAMKAVLARVDKVNPTLNALCIVDTDAALKAARASERRWKKGKELSALDGVPVSIKELIRVKGWPARMASKLTDPAPADRDAPAVARLREAGAIVFAQSTSSEYGHKPVTDSPLHGLTRNPWNIERTPGGSSGGAGAAVASGMGPIAVGTDGGGSVRLPASFTGLVGLKATYGRIPAWPPGLNGDLANTGPMTRTVLDCAMMMNVIARPDARDPTQLPPDDIDYVKKLGGKLKKPRIAFLLRMGDHPIDLEVAALITRAARAFERLGCTVETIDAPPVPFDDASRIFLAHWLSNAQRLLQMYPESRHGEFDPNLLAYCQAGQKYSMQDVVTAHAQRRDMTVVWNQFFEKYDFLLTPMLAIQPFAVLKNLPDGPDGQPNRRWSPYSSVFNLTRHPALTVPCGISRERLPIGLQLVSGYFKDAALLRLAAAYTEAHPIVFPRLPENLK